MKKDYILRQEQRQPLRQLYMWLKSLQSTLIFMQTGAHPDDETSRMLARLSLGDGMHVVYVNAVRGQGGQNALGPERGDALGYLRTEELFEAMRTIRADIAWLAESPEDPIRDFGFSKSGKQTFEYWGREHTLRQMVKMIRLFKPDILIPTFLDVPGQHGHHRAITQTTIAAFDEAADHTKFADLGLAAWQVNTLYLPAWSGGGGIDGERLNRRAPKLKSERGVDGMLNIDAIADAYWVLHHQHRSAWTLELDLRPWSENF